MNDDHPVLHLVDDDEQYLKATARLLRAAGFAVQTYASAAEFLASSTGGAPGCVVVDLQMPEVDGLELQRRLAGADDSLPVVFLTGHADVPTSVRAMRQGAEDFLSKTAPQADLLAAVRRALDRDAQLRAERAAQDKLRAPFDTLTPREREVLGHVLTGEMNKQIARALGIDERSVKRHRTSIMAKLQVESVAELVHLVHDAGLRSTIRKQDHLM
jgi:FixJ family two-component response regulator